MQAIKTHKGAFLFDLAGDIRRAALQLGLPVVLIGTLPLLGILAWRLAMAVSLSQTGAWSYGVGLAAGIFASAAIRYFKERREAWLSDTLWTIVAGGIAFAERSPLALALLGFALGSLMSDYASRARRNSSRR